MCRRRDANDRSRLAAMTPCATCATRLPVLSTTPQPVFVSPGSIPRTRIVTCDTNESGTPRPVRATARTHSGDGLGGSARGAVARFPETVVARAVRKQQAEGGAAAPRWPVLQPPAMRERDLPGEAEADAGAARLGGEERRERRLGLGRCQSGTVVDDGDRHAAVPT